MDEKYQRIRVLGKGSFGKAYLVKNTEAKEFCVVKQMETSMMDPKERNEAVKEAMLLKRMDHPNIVRFQEVFMTRKGRLCIVMDYADGGDVHMEIKRRDGQLLPEAKIIEWFVQTCFALKHVHDQKVLHRDLKTQNIFLMATGQIKLGDFGIAKVLEATEGFAKTMVGTPYYLSPEIIEDKPYNFKSDVWSIGVVLYEMATLKHPFDADSLVILASKILKDQYLPLDAMYTVELRELVRTMLYKDWNKRPSIRDILSIPFLQVHTHEANARYGLGVDLSEFAPPEPVVASVPAGSPLATASGEEDSVLMGTTKLPANASAQGAEEDAEYEEEFEDYSGSEDGKDENDIRSSADNLKIAGAGAFPAQKGVAVDGSAIPTAGAPISAISAKAESLRSYLVGQMPRATFDHVYELVRASAEASPDELQRNVAAVLGPKATELSTLFKLLIFLEDVAANNGTGASDSG
jgi:serine/threonine protein kinase